MKKLFRQLIASLTVITLLTPSFQPLLAATDSSVASTSDQATSSSTSTSVDTITSSTSTDSTTTSTTPIVDNATTTVDPAVVDTATVTTDPATTPTKSDKAKKSNTKDSASTLSATSATTSGSTGGGNSTQSKNTLDKLKLQADTATGALTFSYPVIIPSGRNGLQPELNLSYNSQSTDNANIFGYGWSINIPSIERLNKQGIDKLYTANSFASTFSGELLPIASTSSATATVYGSYGSRIDNGEFLQYTFNADNSWTVLTKTGLKYTFGLTTTSRQDDPVNTTRIYKWLLSEIRDTNDNFIKYEYLKDNGQIYPSKIKYTGSGVVDGIYEVEFVRDVAVRSDTNISYNTGFKVTTKYRASEIQVKTNGVWTRRYVLNYTTGDNGVRSLLKGVMESGKDEAGVVGVLPVNIFDYQKKSGAWIENANLPEPFLDVYPGIGVSDTGVRSLDINGDGLVDLVKFRDREPQKVYLNDGQSLKLTTSWTIPGLYFTDIDGRDQGVNFADVNGDGLVDILNSNWTTKAVYLNKGDGTGWVQDQNFVLPEFFIDGFLKDTGVRLLDINGDGLVDIVKFKDLEDKKVYLNNGRSWQLASGWDIPGLYFTDIDGRDHGVRFADVNGDGLVDILNGKGWFTKVVYLNKGDGTGWVEEPNFVLPELFVDAYLKDAGSRLVDINGDGLIDIVKSKSGEDKKVYLNNGKGWQLSASWIISSDFTDIDGRDLGVRLGDVNGDNFIDILQGYRWQKNIYINNNKISDNLISAIYPNQGVSNITYKSSAQYRDPITNQLLNPKTPFSVNTVNQITINDNTTINPNQTTTYTYQDGQYYFDSTNPTNRKFAGFGQITQTDTQGNQVKTYYHQANATNSTQGEYLDHEVKIGKIYRTEIYDNQNKLYQTSINKWENTQTNPTETNLAKQRHFVKLTQSIQQDYDGQLTHKDKAIEYKYDNTTGNQTKVISYGEVTANSDGSFIDIKTDKLTTDLTYTSNPTKYIIGLPAQETTTDQALTKIKETKYYYDNNSTLGSVSLGNLTKQENWLENSTYLTSQTAYNTYGNVVSQTDPNNNTTTYTYDTYNLYPTTVTNPLIQSTTFTYNYNLGKAKQITDPNNAITKITYDGLGRTIKEEQSDIASPATLSTKTIYTYNDTTFPNSIKKTDYLDATNSVDSYTYLDGLSRPIQTKTEAESTNTFSTKDFIYNNLGQLQKESLPYFSNGSSYVAPVGTGVGGFDLHPNLFTTYTYDPLSRITTVTNSLGTTTVETRQWRVSTTDPNNNKKTLTKDAYDNLIKVEEYYSSTSQNSATQFTAIYTTSYQYNALSNLTKITDAQNNVRNFSYDNLGRLKISEDLHNPADTTFGIINYGYDNNSNLTSKTDAKNQTTVYSYDALNRLKSEDYLGQAGIEVSNVYDNCLNGIGRLCSTTSSAVTTNYQYNILGLTQVETKQINAINYPTQYLYNRQGQTTQVIYPDNSTVDYTYNTAGQFETVKQQNNPQNLPANTNLKAYWSADEGSGLTLYDNSNNLNNGQLFNMDNTNWISGISGKAFNLDGVDDFIEVANSTSLDTTSSDKLTVASWFNLDTAKTGGIAVKMNNAPSSGYRLMIEGGTYLRGDLFTSDNINNINNTVGSNAKSATSTGSWYFGAMVYDGSVLKLYLNGVEVDSTPVSGTITPNSLPIEIGQLQAGTGLHLDGKIDELRIYHQALTSTEIQSLYNNPNTNKSNTLITQTDYNPLGQITYQKAGNGIQTAYAYDENKLYRLTNKTTTGNTTYQNLTYTYDNVGNITQIADNSSVSGTHNSTYQYDSLYRLTQAQTTSPVQGSNHNFTQTYGYDPIGNIAYKSDQGTYQYNGNQGTSYANPHAVTNIINGKTFTYDKNGNLENDGTWTHTWDYNNRLISSTNGTKTVSYGYDQSGNRISKTDGTKTTYYINQYYDIENGQIKKHIFAGSDKVATIENNNTYYHHTDHLTGSNIETDQNGIGVELVDYYPFGSVRVDSKAGDYSNDYKYTGKELDTDTGLYYYGARYYMSEIGRFVSEDPVFWDMSFDIFDPQSLNSYTYSLNNPLRYLDPDGRAAKGAGYYQANPSSKEIGFLFRNPITAFKIGIYIEGAKNISTITGNFTINSGLSNNTPHALGSHSNAFRHVLWQSIIINKYGNSIANQVGNAHEDDPFVDLSVRSFSGTDAWKNADQTADLLNNEIGKQIGLDNPHASSKWLAYQTLEYFHDTGLFVAEQDGDEVKVVQTKLTNDQYKDAKSNLSQTGNDGKFKKNKN